MDDPAARRIDEAPAGLTVSSEILRALTDGGWFKNLATSLAGRDSDDLVQDVALRALRRPPKHEATGPWLVAVLRHRAASLWRSKARRSKRERVAANREVVESKTDQDGKNELRAIVARELLALPEPYRSTLLRRFFEERSFAEIADLDGVEVGTVRWRQHHALALLRTRLDRRYGDDRAAWLPLLVPLPQLSTHAAAWGFFMKTSTSLVAAGLFAALGVWFWLGQVSNSTDPSPAQSVVEADREVEPATPSLQESATPPLRESFTELAAAPDAVSPVAADRARLRVRFVDPSGVPIRGARVGVSMRPSRTVLRDDPQATSGTDGRAVLEFASRFPGEPIGDSLFATIAFEAEDYQRQSTEILLWRGRDLDLGDVVLREAGRIVGRVLDTSGRAVDDALVVARFRNSDLGGAPPGSESSPPSTRTNSRGEFVIHSASPGFVSISAGDVKGNASESVLVAVTAGMETRVRDLLVVEDGTPRVHGRIVDPHGAPLAGAEILLFGWEDDRSVPSVTYRATSDDAGYYGVRLERTGEAEDLQRYTLLVFDGDGRGAPLRVDSITPDVPPFDAPLNLKLAEPTTLTLRVVSRFGAPIEQFLAVEELIEGDEELETRLLTPGGVARFPGGQLEFARPPTRFQISIVAPGFRCVERPIFDPAQLGAEVVVMLEPNVPIRGRVVDARGPVEGARVSLARPLATEGMASIGKIAGAFPVEFAGAGVVPVLTDATGRFEIAPTASGDYRLHAAAPGHGATSSPTFMYDLERSPGEFELVLPQAGSIAGEVFVGPSESAARRIVGASCGDGFVRTTRADGTGRFRFDDLEPGAWLVALASTELDLARGSTGYVLGESIPKPPPHARTVEVRAGETASVILDLPNSGVARLTGRIDLVGASPAPHSVYAALLDANGRRDGSHPTVGAALKPDGSFALTLPEIGKYAFTFHPENERLVISKDLDIREGENELSLTLQLGRVSLRSLDPIRTYRLQQDDPTRGLRVTSFFTPNPQGEAGPFAALLGSACLDAVVFDETTESFVADTLVDTTRFLVTSSDPVVVEASR